jgi:CMP-N-acetylneuraminic acid synthetase
LSNISVFLPMRKGSQRVKNKNIRDFSGVVGGLTYIKLSQLLEVKEITTIIVSTDDEKVKEIAKSFNSNKIVIDDRPSNLASSNTSTDDLIKYVPSIINKGAVLWTHVTSPFIDSSAYSQAIKCYFNNLNNNDSLMSVTEIQKFIWNESGPITYDSNKEKWPRTQTLSPLYEINSGIFLADIEIYKNQQNRIGKKPFFFKLDSKMALDIDWKDDFDLAEALWEKQYG